MNVYLINKSFLWCVFVVFMEHRYDHAIKRHLFLSGPLLPPCDHNRTFVCALSAKIGPQAFQTQLESWLFGVNQTFKVHNLLYGLDMCKWHKSYDSGYLL